MGAILRPAFTYYSATSHPSHSSHSSRARQPIEIYRAAPTVHPHCERASDPSTRSSIGEVADTPSRIVCFIFFFSPDLFLLLLLFSRLRRGHEIGGNFHRVGGIGFDAATSHCRPIYWLEVRDGKLDCSVALRRGVLRVIFIADLRRRGSIRRYSRSRNRAGERVSTRTLRRDCDMRENGL